MLRAIAEDGNSVLGWNAVKDGQYYCPGCEGTVLFKPGRTVTPHFAHLPGAACEYAEGESLRHLAMKATMVRMFPEGVAEVEVPMLPGHRADVLIRASRTVIECQASKLLAAEWERRTRDYNRMGYAVLWVWDGARMTYHARHDDIAAAYRQEGIAMEDEYRIPDEMRLCHKQAFGKVYQLDERYRLCSVHFERTTRFNDYTGMQHHPYTLRVPTFYEITAPLRLRQARSSNGYLLGDLSEGTWWK